MASKSSKKSSAAASTPMQTPQASTSSSSGRPQSPLSPTRFNRLQEKAELQNLNDRLAVYIDRVRQLETENNRLTREIQSYQEVSTREVTSIKSMYEQELSEARKLLDETSREKAKMEIDMKRIWEEHEELKARFDKKSKDCAIAEKSSASFESRYNDLTGKYNQSQADRKKAQDDAKELEKELDKLRKLLDAQRKQLEDEMLSRVEAENKLQTCREELNLKEQVFDQEMKETRTRRQVEISEIDNRLVEEYNAKLQLSLQELRDQYEQQMRANRDDIEVLYENKMRDLKNQMQKNSGAATQMAEERRGYKLQLETVQGKIAGLESMNLSLTARLQELERLLDAERDRHKFDLAQVEAEAQRMREEMAAQLTEYQDLMDVKVALDLEIAAYHKLLESEEARLNITPMSPSMQQSSRFTPVRRTPARGNKRKRTMMEESESMDEYDTKASSKGDIEFVEACPQGRFVKLRNKGDKEASLSGWQLIRKAGEAETSYKFHRTVKVDAGATVTVWSADQGQTHEPPTNIVMKGQKWFVAPAMMTVLNSKEGEEMALLETQRLRMSSSASRHRELGTDEADLYFQRMGSPLMTSDSD